MSEENILISKARYDDIMERLKKYDDQKHKSDDVENDEYNEKEDGRNREDILRDNRALLPPGLQNDGDDTGDDDDDDDDDEGGVSPDDSENIPKEKKIKNKRTKGNSLFEGRVTNGYHEGSEVRRHVTKKQQDPSTITQPHRGKEQTNKKHSDLKKTWISL